MNFTLKTILYGVLVWLVPFLIAIPFYSPEGTLLIDEHFFKTAMILAGGGIGAILLIRLFSGISDQYIRKGWVIGVIWLLINWILDLGILLPLNGMNIPTYFGQIGLRYLMIPVMSIMAGYIAENTANKDHMWP
ncbi:MAG TPA: hypothetical protein PK024_03450 [Methanospirillum sp.]|uniref:hypothetical protein n=1 Tax=Methanospirillum sp. TaxID=45200 RepID=UPI002BC2539D|nr:hypothetical protein [Methanospirillum sp.]HOJ95880.1 hypothetical protein [Methanospirillum sp.]HOL41585.1 hypothetical protein [Methanospirillum sp.]HPP79023.1 hypothetical protein [Methanospirillum sp.]